MKQGLLILSLLGALVAAAAAFGEPIQEFSFEVRDVRPGGRFTVVFTQRSYDTTGAVPVQPNEFHLRLPAGAKLRNEFLNRRVFCNTKKLAASRDPRTCRRSQVGTGRVIVDARPFITDPIPANLSLFLAKGTTKKAVASLAILGKQDQNAPVVKNIPVVRDYRAPLVFMNFLNEPTRDGKYGYKLVFGNSPTGGGGASFAIAETRIVNTGFSLTRKRHKLFWFTPPTCPRSGKVSFEAFFGYRSLPDIVRTTELPCPRFTR